MIGLKKLESWLDTLNEVYEVFGDNVNLDTIINSINAKIKEYKKAS